MSLWLDHKGKEVWKMIRGPEHQFNYDTKHRYRFYQDRVIPEIVPKLGEPAKPEE